ncbi:helix-turn-helix domain-containing protein [Plantibacter flavus]|uniref:helix-turn-helix transcriptional regulator n=1 Tax=Plantibacter flavus TaxID=150123 RepID=UPI003F13B0ED
MHHHFRASATEPGRTAHLRLPSGGLDSLPVPLHRRSAAGNDPESARQHYEDTYPGSRFVVTRGEEPFSFRWRSVGDDRVVLRSAETTGHLRADIPRLDDYVVAWLQAGNGRVELRESTTELPIAPFLMPFERPYAIHLSPHRQNSVRFAAPFLSELAAELRGGDHGRLLSFDTAAVPSADAILQWRTTLAATTSALVDDGTAPLDRLRAQRDLAAALLNLFPWELIDLPTVLREPSMQRVRSALEFLHHHADEAITPADAARAAGLHTRTLQQHFSRVLDTSPSAYLRDVRLDRARRALTHLSPGRTTVAAVAKTWRFAHLGRFSVSYRNRFGERPSDTLRH